MDEKDREKVFQVSGVVRYLFWLGKPAIVRDEEIDVLRDSLNHVMSSVELTNIKAGDIVGDTNVVVEEINTLNAMVYSFGNIIYVKLNEQLKDTEIRVFDIIGKEIFFDEVINQFSQIELTESKGIYFVELISAEKKYTKKIFIN